MSDIEHFVWEHSIEQVHEFNNFYNSFNDLRQAHDWESILRAIDQYHYKNLNLMNAMRAIQTRKAFAVPSEQEWNKQPIGFARWVETNFPERNHSTYEKLRNKAAEVEAIASLASYLNQSPEVQDQMLEDLPNFTEINRTRFKTTDSQRVKTRKRKEIYKIIVEETRDFLVDLDVYAQELSHFLDTIYPAQFRYRNILIKNPNRFTKRLVEKMLSGIDYLITLFQDNGLLAILEKTINAVILEFEPRYGKVSAEYSPNTQEITVFTNAYTSEIADWVKRTFLHEFGHHLHMRYMDENARQFWDSWWSVVQEAQTLQLIDIPINTKERQGFYDDLVKARFNIEAALTGMDRIQKARFLAWLTEPTSGMQYKLLIPYNIDSLFFRTTPLGDEIFSTLSQAKHEGQEQELVDQYLKLLGLTPGSPDMTADDIIKTLLRQAASPDAQEVAKLNIPTNYGQTNKYEDFAETFVEFVLNPRKLAPIAQYRMKRTLSLSGLYGKPIMTFARVVEELIREDMSKEARTLLRSYLKSRDG